MKNNLKYPIPSIGTIFGDRTVIENVRDSSNTPSVLLRCNQGHEAIIRNKLLRKNCSLNCSKCNTNKIKGSKYAHPEIGTIFGKRTVTSNEFTRGTNHSFLVGVICSCGREDNVRIKSLLKGTANSCMKCSKLDLNFDKEFYVGKKYGSRTVIDTTLIRNSVGNRLVKCRCECDEELLIACTQLKAGKCINCHKCTLIKRNKSQKLINSAYIGEVFGSRTVIDITEENRRGHSFLKCRCICGNEDMVDYALLKRGENHRCIVCSGREAIALINISKGILVNQLIQKHDISLLDENETDVDLLFDQILEDELPNTEIIDTYDINEQFDVVLKEAFYKSDPYINKQIGNRIIRKIWGKTKNSKNSIYEVECILCHNISQATVSQVKKHNTKCSKCIQHPLLSPGDRFNKWTVLEFSKITLDRGKFYICKCDCGTIKDVQLTALIKKRSTQCHKCAGMAKLIIPANTTYRDFIGKKYGSLTILEFVNNYKHYKTYARCLCDCGREFHRCLNNIINKNQTKCFVCSFSKVKEDPYIGQKFGKKTIIEVVNRKNITIQCECGNISKTSYKDQLRFAKDNPDTACVDCIRKLRFLASEYSKIYAGQRFGSRIIINTDLIYNKTNQPQVAVKCDCGGEDIVLLRGLIIGRSKKCRRCYSTKGIKKSRTNVSGPKISVRKKKIGMILGKWTIISINNEETNKKRIKYNIQCECGFICYSRIDIIAERKCLSSQCNKD